MFTIPDKVRGLLYQGVKWVTPANPGGGGSYSIPVAADEIWLINSFSVAFTSNATVANRIFRLKWLATSGAPPTGVAQIRVFTTALVASKVARILADLNCNATEEQVETVTGFDVDFHYLIKIPPVFLTGNVAGQAANTAELFQCDAVNIQAGDAFTSAIMQVHYWGKVR